MLHLNFPPFRSPLFYMTSNASSFIFGLFFNHTNLVTRDAHKSSEYINCTQGTLEAHGYTAIIIIYCPHTNEVKLSSYDFFCM